MQSTDVNPKGLTGPILVLLCKGVERNAPGLHPEELDGWLSAFGDDVVVQKEPVLCHDFRALPAILRKTLAARLVLGLCSSSHSLQELHTWVRKCGLDPLGVQVVPLVGSREGEVLARQNASRMRILLAAAIGRARAFPGSRPENLKAVLLPFQEKIGRRAFLTLPPLTYESVPAVETARCTSPAGCDLCLEACPAGAIHQEGDALMVDRARCKSCGACVSACPERAMDFPGWSADELEAQLAALFEAAGPEGPEVLFACKKPSPLPEGPWLPVRVPCAASVPIAVMLLSLAWGARAVGLGLCSSTCPAVPEATVAGKVAYCRRLLEVLGESPERVFLLNLADGQQRAAHTVAPSKTGSRPSGRFVGFGKGADASAVRELARQYDRQELLLEHPFSPLGLVSIDGRNCTACGTCAAACSSAALTREQEGDQVQLVFDPSLCTGCGRCVFACPEKEAGALAVAPVTDLKALRGGARVLVSDAQVHCKICGAPVASAALLKKLAVQLEGGAGTSARFLERCPTCRAFS